MDNKTLSEAQLKQPLYLIAVKKNTFPFLMQGNVVLLYSQLSKAEQTVKNFRQSFDTSYEIKVVLIKDTADFFARMVAYGLNKFLLDGSGTVLKFSDYCDIDAVEAITDAEKTREEIDDIQPTRKNTGNKPEFTISSIATAFNMLNKKLKKHLIIAYVCGFLSVTSCTILGVFQHHNSPLLALFFLVALVSIIKGLDSATNVSMRVKERNPIMSKVAMFSCFMHLIAVIIFTVLMSVL